jgi:phosphoribosylamine---glycine ligase
MGEAMRVLVVGSGGREHALCWAIKRSPLCAALFCAPGNPGTAMLGGNVPIAADRIDDLVAFAVGEAIDLVVIGPEEPLTLGLADALRARGVAVFGPSAAAARLEASKGFMKDAAVRFGIPTAAYGRFTDAAAAHAFVRRQGAPIVVKTDGLAAGKGVSICMSVAEAEAAINAAMLDRQFGQAGAALVIEEYLEGEEISFFALCDGKTALALVAAQDHKRAFDGDRGPNTGGMGAYAPTGLDTPALREALMRDMIMPTVRGMAAEGAPFIGTLFAGVMLTKGADGAITPQLLEYNVRFGDPETQALMRLLDTDALALFHAAATGGLATIEPPCWHPGVALCVVMAAQGYPGPYAKGTAIKGVEAADAMPGVEVFRAGVSLGEKGRLLAQGGRALGVTALAASVEDARALAYAAVDKIDWPQGFCRRDIAWRAVGRPIGHPLGNDADGL